MRVIRYVLLASSLIIVATRVAAARELETVNVEEVLKIDALTDGVMTIKFTFTGLQFQKWQAKYGQNQSLLKRDLSKYVSQYEIYDWDVQTTQMDRVVIISCKVKGAGIHKGGGHFEFRVPKAWRGGERMGSTYVFNYVDALANGVVVQNNVKLILPDAASHFSEDHAETGDRIIQYALPVGGTGKLTLWLGLISLLAGGLLVAFALWAMRHTGPAAARPSPA